MLTSWRTKLDLGMCTTTSIYCLLKLCREPVLLKIFASSKCKYSLFFLNNSVLNLSSEDSFWNFISLVVPSSSQLQKAHFTVTASFFGWIPIEYGSKFVSERKGRDPDCSINMVSHGSIHFNSTDFFLPLLRLFFLSHCSLWGLPCRTSPD